MAPRPGGQPVTHQHGRQAQPRGTRYTSVPGTRRYSAQPSPDRIHRLYPRSCDADV